MSGDLRVFVSYSHADGERIAGAVSGALNHHRSGMFVSWIDHELRRGDDFDDVIKAEIADADIAVCVVTPGFNGSSYIQKDELPAILKRAKRKTAPLLVVPVPAGGALEGALAAFHAGDLSEELSEGSADREGRAYKALAEDLYDRVRDQMVGVRRKQMTAAQRRKKVREFVQACASWEVEEENYQDFWRGLMGLLGYVKPEELLKFQKKARRADGSLGKLDCFVPGRFVGESKSRSVRDLDGAELQALEYARAVEDTPQVLVSSNYALVRVSALTSDGELKDTVEFPVEEIGEHLNLFEALFTDDYAVAVADALAAQAPQSANKAHIRLITDFRDILVSEGMGDKQAFSLTMRVLFLLVADDLGILNSNPSDHTPGRFDKFLRGLADGRDATGKLQALFAQLNDEAAWARGDGFPYVNGGLFADSLAFPALTDRALTALQDASRADWSGLDPFVFGSLYQQTHTREDRAEHGQHFTSADNIRKALDPLFLDDLRARLGKARGKRGELVKLQEHLAEVRVLDPAAGCGNFLLVAYQDAKDIERDIITELIDTGLQPYSALMDAGEGQFAGKPTLALRATRKGEEDRVVPLVQMSHFAGIEIDPTAAALARTVLILAAVQAESALGETTDLTRTPLPLSDDTNATVHAENALQFNWADAWVDYTGGFTEHTFIVGNPPFLGSNMTTESQKSVQAELWGGARGSGAIDFVANWFLLAGRYLEGTRGRAALVATNSITQGEQPAILWGQLRRANMGIDFAYRTFAWANGAGQQAAVHCVIVGFSALPKPATRPLWDESGTRADVPMINAYLVNGPEFLVTSRSRPLDPTMQAIVNGSKPTDAGHLSNISLDEAATMRKADSVAARYLRRLVGAKELIDGKERFCLWLTDVDPADVKASPTLRDRIAAVKAFREESSDPQTQRDANIPHLFQKIRQPHAPYLAVPRHSSERRPYVPMALLPPSVIAMDAISVVPDATPYTFGLLSSTVFTVWNSVVSGRIKSDYRISSEITYNNFPSPPISEIHHGAISTAAQGVLDARAAHPDVSLADLYDPETFYLYTGLKAAHDALDKTVLAAYGLRTKACDEEILRALVDRYVALTGQETT